MRFLVLVVIVGCGGGGGGGNTGPISEADAERACTGMCEREVVCEDDILDECVADCVDELSGWARTDAIEAIYGCVAELTCDIDEEDTCGPAAQPLAIHRAYEDHCRQGMADCLEPREINSLCEVDFEADAPGDAGFMRFFAPVLIEAMDACFGGAVCEDRLRCLQDVVDAFGVSL